MAKKMEGYRHAPKTKQEKWTPSVIKSTSAVNSLFKVRPLPLMKWVSIFKIFTFIRQKYIITLYQAWIHVTGISLFQYIDCDATLWNLL